ncbi:MAG TPA: peptidoglycan-associated lipoprotein Pal [Verrucomicrobiae bacterium]|nr:peptidoglycan-associated lipoprotein Pal [Verrucomicrobiae bacterium]
MLPGLRAAKATPNPVGQGDVKVTFPTKTKRMKLKNLLNLMVLGSALTITAVGCRTKPLNPMLLPNRNLPPRDANALDQPKPFDTGSSSVTTTGIPPTTNDYSTYIPDVSALKAQTVYFDFDKSAIKSSEQSKLEDVANYMKSHGDAAVRIEGNCDERGTEEYNRSLGERRALSAREYLVRLGIDPNKIPTISYGNDKPAEPGHNESAWSKNRRDDFVVLNPPKP